MNVKKISALLLFSLLSGCSAGPVTGRHSVGGGASSQQGADGASPQQANPPANTANPDNVDISSSSADGAKYFPETTLAAVPATLWRLPATDIAEVYEWLFGAGAVMTRDLEIDFETRGIRRGRANLLIPLTQNWYAKYLDVGKTNSELSASKSHLKSLFSCNTGEVGSNCFGRLRDSIIKPLFLGTFSVEQETQYRDIFDKSAMGNTMFDAAVFSVVTTALRSPFFLFVRDLGGTEAVSAGAAHLTNAETRAVLAVSSSSIVSAMKSVTEPVPDLSDETKRKAFLNNALNKPAGIQFLARFYASLGSASAIPTLKKDVTLFPEFTPDLQADMATQVQRTLEHSIEVDGASAVELMKTRNFWMTPALATLYAYKGLLPADGFAKVDSATRAGFWSMAGIQAALAGTNESQPMHRGKVFLSNALCQDLGAPPPQAVADFEASMPTHSLREKFDVIGKTPQCAGCHANLNPFGLSMESYNAIGKVRTVYESNGMDVNAAIDSQSSYMPVGRYKNASEIFDVVATSPIYWQCVVRQAFTHATGHTPAGYDPLLRKAFDAFVKSELNIRELFIEILASETFQSRMKSM